MANLYRQKDTLYRHIYRIYRAYPYCTYTQNGCKVAVNSGHLDDSPNISVTFCKIITKVDLIAADKFNKVAWMYLTTDPL